VKVKDLILPKYKVGEKVIFEQPYLEGTTPQFPEVIIKEVRCFPNDEEHHYLFYFNEDAPDEPCFVWFPESMFLKEAK
jgi:hypothetical protein